MKPHPAAVSSTLWPFSSEDIRKTQDISPTAARPGTARSKPQSRLHCVNKKSWKKILYQSLLNTSHPQHSKPRSWSLACKKQAAYYLKLCQATKLFEISVGKNYGFWQLKCISFTANSSIKKKQKHSYTSQWNFLLLKYPCLNQHELICIPI